MKKLLLPLLCFSLMFSFWEINLKKNDKEKNNIKIFKGYTITDTFGYKRINKISIKQLSKDGQKVVGPSINLSCDCLGVSGGWTPAVHLLTQSGG